MAAAARATRAKRRPQALAVRRRSESQAGPVDAREGVVACVFRATCVAKARVASVPLIRVP
jgi:hypothetical protein